MKQLVAIQSALVCQKNQNNKFGNYNYRSCEDILEALKPLLEKHDATLTVRDEVKQVENVPQMIIVDESTKRGRGDYRWDMVDEKEWASNGLDASCKWKPHLWWQSDI